MRTEAQIQASRRNGAKSRGPVTPQGKHRSSQNAIKHGLSARTVVLCTESHELFEQLEQDYIDSLQPTTILELHLVQRIAVAEWRMRRAWAVETAITDKCMAEHKAQDEKENPQLDNDYRLGLNQKRVEKDLSAVQRAEARFERTQARALAEFHRLRKLRPPGSQPIQITRPDLSTSGRDPSQHLQPRNEPKPQSPPWKELAIVIPNYQCTDQDDHEPDRRIAA
jgi:hypothetical protein